MINYAAINSEFSTKVLSLISMGYKICTNTMSGSQGDIARIDFCKENAEGEIEYFLLTLEEEGWCHNDTKPRLGSLVITLMKNKDIKGDLKDRTRITLWRDDSHNEILERECFWRVAEDCYTTNTDEAFEIVNKRSNRWYDVKTVYRQEVEVTVNGNTRKLFAKLFNNHKATYQKRIKAVDIDEIALVRHNDAHYISILAAGKRNVLHI